MPWHRRPRGAVATIEEGTLTLQPRARWGVLLSSPHPHCMPSHACSASQRTSVCASLLSSTGSPVYSRRGAPVVGGGGGGHSPHAPAASRAGAGDPSAEASRQPWTRLPPVTTTVVANLARMVTTARSQLGADAVPSAVDALPPRFFAPSCHNASLADRDSLAESQGCVAPRDGEGCRWDRMVVQWG
jgi:hypothetical protein